MSDTELDLHAERTDYGFDVLHRERLSADPMQLFDNWVREALARNIKDATAMTLATVGSDNRPSARVVLLKKFDADGLCWYTNYNSHKGREIAANPNAALVLFWPEIERQIRVEGAVKKMSAAESDSYFYSRPAPSRYSAAVSPQSEAVDNQLWLQQQLDQLHRQYPNDDVPRPEHWGGYRLQPKRFEFWQGRPGRLHDRFEYRLIGTSAQPDWQINRLAP